MIRIVVEVTQDDYDCLVKHLREDLLPEQWLKDAMKGKINNCKSRDQKAKFERLKKDPAKLKIALDLLEE